MYRRIQVNTVPRGWVITPDRKGGVAVQRGAVTNACGLPRVSPFNPERLRTTFGACLWLPRWWAWLHTSFIVNAEHTGTAGSTRNSNEFQEPTNLTKQNLVHIDICFKVDDRSSLRKAAVLSSVRLMAEVHSYRRLKPENVQQSPSRVVVYLTFCHHDAKITLPSTSEWHAMHQ